MGALSPRTSTSPVVESLQLHGDQDDFDALAKHSADKDRWVREAKFQTMEVNPEEW